MPLSEPVAGHSPRNDQEKSPSRWTIHCTKFSMEFSTEVSESVDDPFARNSPWKYLNNDQNVIQRARETGAVGGSIVITGWELCPQLANSPLGAALLPGRDPRGIAGRFLMMGGQFHPWHGRPSNDAESRSVESGGSQNGIHRCRGSGQRPEPDPIETWERITARYGTRLQQGQALAAAQQQILRAGGEKGSGTVDAVLEVEATIERGGRP